MPEDSALFSDPPLAGVVLCGGMSTRMRTPKAWLPFGPETMLARVVRLLRPAVDSIVVVAAAHQELPELAADIRVVRDRRPARGPLEGIRAGLAALDSAAAAYVTSCDVPLLAPGFVARMRGLLGAHDAAAPWVDGFYHPLAAIYRRSILPHIEDLLAHDRLRPAFLFERVSTRQVTADELVDVDPDLKTLRNLNRPEDYLRALAEAGFSPDPAVLRRIEESSG